MRVPLRLLQALVLAFLAFSALAYAGPDIGKEEILLKPKGVDGLDKKKNKLPLIVFLHAAGGNPISLERSFTGIKDDWNAYVYLPCGGTQLKKDKNDYQTYDWRSKDTTNLVAKIQQIVRVNKIDPTLVFLSGFSAGASMSYLVGIEAPYLFAGIIPFSGSFPKNYIDPKKFKAAKRKYPTYIVHGNKDRTIPVSKVRADCVYLNQQGFNSELHLCDCGHEFPDDWATILSEAVVWCNKR